MKKKRNMNEDKVNSGLSMDLDEPIINLNNTLTNNYKLTNTNNKINGINHGNNFMNNGNNSVNNDKQSDLDEEMEYKFIPELNVKTKLKDVGGIDKIKGEIEDLVINPLKYPQLYKHLGVQPTKGVLLHGPPGSGKTKLAEAIAGEIGCPFFRVAATEIVTGMSGESENRLRSLFDQAKACAPSIIFLDELDSITPKRENTFREMEKRIVSQLGICMDSLQGHFVIVIGATNRQEYVDSMIRRNGRFDREISMGIPNQESRYDILQALSENIKISDDVDFEEIANLTPGFVGADLQAVLRESAIHSISRLFKSHNIDDTDMNDLMKNLYINREDFLIGINKVQPSSKREGFITIPDVTWSKIGALSFLKSELEKQIVFPIKYKKLYQRFGIGISAGILLYGPPGFTSFPAVYPLQGHLSTLSWCGKTLLAKAISNECNANFISIKGLTYLQLVTLIYVVCSMTEIYLGPEILNKYVGESEKAIRLIFQRAATSSPCIIFFDEVDSLCSIRNDSNQVYERIVNQLLTEMDGIQNREYVYIIAATNRPDIIDPAILRPGRLEKLFYVPLPNEDDRVDILLKLTSEVPIDPLVNFQIISQMTDGYLSLLLIYSIVSEGLSYIPEELIFTTYSLNNYLLAIFRDNSGDRFSGADLASLCREASIIAIDEIRLSLSESPVSDYKLSAPENSVVKMEHFQKALLKVKPSVKQQQIDFYHNFKLKYS
ncbi:ATPase, putative [Theileria annulata]|uniref:ATPase, putative n=1 Tax=Theileria annulata TaxID=5874 RepID=Q4UJ01_THEAN|nr:ATPase, putative [Theileria annulata]CAI72938.1 ATPase, putative [Theileria annulata]|eukprot:XP_953616.1 ATPase, putative [Theileria annulata]